MSRVIRVQKDLKGRVPKKNEPKLPREVKRKESIQIITGQKGGGVCPSNNAQMRGGKVTAKRKGHEVAETQKDHKQALRRKKLPDVWGT